MIIASVFIEPHERYEAIEAYHDRLTSWQITQIKNAPASAIIKLQFGIGTPGTSVIVIEEG